MTTSSTNSSLVFTREHRLITSREFTNVFASPNKFMFKTKHFKCQAVKSTASLPRLGLTIQKRLVKRAHDRNRLKRLLRETFRHYVPLMPNYDFIFLVNSYHPSQTNEEIVSSIKFTFEHFLKYINKQQIQLLL